MLIVDGKNYDIIEAIEVNFDGILNDMKVEKDDFGRYIHVQKEHDQKSANDEKCEGDRKLLVYRVQTLGSKITILDVPQIYLHKMQYLVK